jgi:hypothetical protein
MRQTIKSVCKRIHRALVDAIIRTKQNRNYDQLIWLANEAIFALLSTNSLPSKERKILCKLISELESYTGDINSSASKYAKEHSQNTCDYKIARELVMKFCSSLDYETLASFVNHYYYDTILVDNALEAMIDYEYVKGHVHAVKNTQASVDRRKSEADMKMFYWSRLRDTADISFSFDDIQDIAIMSTMPKAVQDDCIRYVLKNGLLDGHKAEKYYKFLFKKITLPAKTWKQAEVLHKKHEPKLIELARLAEK